MLWGAAKLTSECDGIGGSGVPACAEAAATAPLLACEQAHALLAGMCARPGAPAPAAAANALWALSSLQRAHSWCLCASQGQVQLLLCAVADAPPSATPAQAQPALRAAAQLAAACAPHAGSAWLDWTAPVVQRLLAHMLAQVCPTRAHAAWPLPGAAPCHWGLVS